MSSRGRPGPPHWWEFPWREIGAFLTGSAILIWQTVFEQRAQAVLVGAGLALMGVLGTGSVQRLVRRWLDEGTRDEQT